MSRAERLALIDRHDPELPVTRQCGLMTVSRSSVYRPPAPGQRRGSGDHGANRSAVSGSALLWLAPYGGVAGNPGPPGQPQAGPATNAADRAGGGLSAAEHEQAGGRAQGPDQMQHAPINDTARHRLQEVGVRN